MTERQKNIKLLREQLNTVAADEIHPFSPYKIRTYLCVIIPPLVPLAVYRIWNGKADFTLREQRIWTAVIIAILIYMVKIT